MLGSAEAIQVKKMISRGNPGKEKDNLSDDNSQDGRFWYSWSFYSED